MQISLSNIIKQMLFQKTVGDKEISHCRLKTTESLNCLNQRGPTNYDLLKA